MSRKAPMKVTVDTKEQILAHLKQTHNAAATARQFGVTFEIAERVASRHQVKLEGQSQYLEIRSKAVAERRADVAEKLGAMPIPNATKLAAEIGRDVRGVTEAAKMADIDLVAKSESGLYQSLRIITGRLPLHQIAELIGMNARNINRLIHHPELVSRKWIDEIMIPKLSETFPDKSAEIARFTNLAYQQCSTSSVSRIKRVLKGEEKEEILKNFKMAAGTLLGDLRKECDVSIECVQEQLNNPLVKNNIIRIEAGDETLPLSIYREAIRDLGRVYSGIEPEKSAPYLPQLEAIAHQLRA